MKPIRFRTEKAKFEVKDRDGKKIFSVKGSADEVLNQSCSKFGVSNFVKNVETFGSKLKKRLK
jgi:hypothetical protein